IAGEAVVLQPRELALPAFAEIFPQVFDRRLQPDVAEEVAVALVAGEALVGVPHLAAARLVSSEDVEPVGRDTGGEGEGLARLRRGGQTVFLDESPVDPLALENGTEGGSVGAFGQ